MAVLTELNNRGVDDVFFVVCDGLKGLPDSVNTVWEYAIVQTCVIHLIRGSFRYASKKYWTQIAQDLKQIYQAINADAALAALDEFEQKWGPQYPATIRLCATRGPSSSRSWTTTSRSAASSVPQTRSNR